ncbi:MAG: ion transporter [Planctomycetes bacterium]|nr:ion transporter [Planctomycetota bacterium]
MSSADPPTPDPAPPAPEPQPAPGGPAAAATAPEHAPSTRERWDAILNEADSLPGRVVEFLTGALILIVCGIYVVDREISSGHLAALEPLQPALQTVETLITVVFLIEYFVRWWASGSWRYPLRPLAIVDLIACLPLFFPQKSLQFVRILRMFRVLRLLRLVQSRKFFFGEVTLDHLLVLRIMFTIFCLVFITGGFVYELERDVNGEQFPSLFDAFYFAIVTLTTVGFGDQSPVTAGGRLATACMILLGVLVIPWQLTNLARHLVTVSNKKDTMCKGCGLKYHDHDASHCKACGRLIFQEYDG